MAPLQLVTAFCEAWAGPGGSGTDWDFIWDAMAPDIFYHNIPMPPCVGIPAVRAFFAGFPFDSAEFVVHHIAANGDVVLTERTDKFVIGGKPLALRVMGVFEIAGGKIAAWRDYFDLAEFNSQLAG